MKGRWRALDGNRQNPQRIEGIGCKRAPCLVVSSASEENETTAPPECRPTCRRRSQPDDYLYHSFGSLKLDPALSGMAYSSAP
jgi:hypothetical protein